MYRLDPSIVKVKGYDDVHNYSTDVMGCQTFSIRHQPSVVSCQSERAMNRTTTNALKSGIGIHAYKETISYYRHIAP